MSWDRLASRAAQALLVALLVVAVVASLRGGDAVSAERARQALAPGADAADVVAWWAMGARSMVLVTLTATLVAGALGTSLGAVSVYLAGGLGVALARLVELSGSVPSIILVGLLRLWDPTGGVVSLVATLALLRTVEVAQLVRAKVLTTMPSDFVEASRALGASRRWQLRVHVLPHLARPLAANLAFGASSLVGLEAALSFAGLGLPPDVPSWGAALRELARAGSGEALLLTVASLGLTSAALYWLGARMVAGLGGEAPKGGMGPLAD